MKFSNIVSGAVASVALLASSAVAADASSVDPIVVKGKHFFYSTNGTEFFIRGVAYQQDYTANGSALANAMYTDPLADFNSCSRDIPYLVKLRTNTIRTYALDPTADHGPCMNALAAAGIYVISDLSSPEQSINRDDPAWTTDLYARYTAVVDNMSQYKNVIGFFAGNEVSNSFNTTSASAYVKAAVRDTKAYIKAQGYRTMYVGYATYDGPIRNQLADYFNCGDPTEAIDFWGYNVYSWCGASSYTQSGYDLRTEFFANYSVPAFFAEYGCNTVEPRPFTEVQALFGSEMTGVWSGGIVYQYFQNTANYGLVTIVDSSTVSPLVDFTSYSNQIATVSPALTAMSAYATGTLAAQACPTTDSSWSAVASPLPPSPNQDLCNCLVTSLSCTVKNGTDSSLFGDLFDYICQNDPNACSGILSNGQTGDYGAYSGCTSEQQLSYVMDRYYVDSGSQASACDFSGNATSTAAQSPSGSCVSLLSVAGTSGLGSVPSPTGQPSYSNTAGSGAASTGASGAGSGASSTASTTGAASAVEIQSYEFSLFHMSFYVIGAVLTGAGMILL